MRSEEIYQAKKRGSSGFRVANRGGAEDIAQRKSNFLLTVSHGDIIRKINSYHEVIHDLTLARRDENGGISLHLTLGLLSP